MKIGDTLPAISLAATGGDTVSLSQLAGAPTVIYFYPKDDTSGCTLEGQEFSRLKPAFDAAGARIFGVSRESIPSHERFCSKYGFTITLLSDPDEIACKAFDVMKEKSMYGRKYLGIERSTFLFGADGRLAREWRGVKVPGHAEEVLAAVRAL